MHVHDHDTHQHGYALSLAMTSIFWTHCCLSNGSHLSHEGSNLKLFVPSQDQLKYNIDSFYRITVAQEPKRVGTFLSGPIRMTCSQLSTKNGSITPSILRWTWTPSSFPSWSPCTSQIGSNQTNVDIPLLTKLKRLGRYGRVSRSYGSLDITAMRWI